MEKLVLLGLVLLAQQAASQNVIYKLSKEEFSRMPPKFHADRFLRCMGGRGVYCAAYADVVADAPSELLDMMRAYSAHSVTHYNYTNLRYGLCLTQECRSFYNGSDNEADLKTSSEACLNHSLSAEYGLKTRVTEVNCYFEGKSKYSVDWMDRLVALLLLGVLALNVLGTAYGRLRDRTKPANPILMAFSLSENWKRLKEPPSSDPKMKQLRQLNGMKVMSAILTVLGHAALPLFFTIENTNWLEKVYDHPMAKFMLHGHLLMTTFFLISGLLLAYNTQVMAEKVTLSWNILPRAIFNRWLRLTPMCMVFISITATFMRFADYGPFGQIIGLEAQDCRDYWFYNLFHLHNFNDHSQCLLQTWSTACDFHLHIIGMAVMVLSPSAKVRWWCLGALFAVGLAWPAYNIYTMDLDATMLASPRAMLGLFIKEPTFNYLYKRTYTNLPSFVAGILLGYLIYDWQKRNVFARDLTKYRYLYWLLLPALVMLVSAAGFYCRDAPRASLPLRLAYGPVVRPLIAAVIALFILGTMFKVENAYRGILEWRGWAPLARVSYCVSVSHVAIVRYLHGTRVTLFHISGLHMIHYIVEVLVFTGMVAVTLHLTIEAPLSELIRLLLDKKPPKVSNGTVVNENGANENAIKYDDVVGSEVKPYFNEYKKLNGEVNESANNGHVVTKSKNI